jgi:signal transduction histidine kinase
VWLVGKLALHSRVQLVVQRERARIARDIHDDLSAGLTQLVLIGEVVQSTLPAGSESRQQAGVGCEKARGLVQSMHDVIWAIDSRHDSTCDFSSHVCRYAESFLQPTSIRCHFDLDEEMPDFPFDLGRRRNLFLAVKEALHNAVRHSGASELVLRIHRQGNWIVVIIEDNGKGFEPARRGRVRNGLSNMQKRAADAGGTCSIVSQPAGGCRVILSVPLVHSKGGPAGWLPRIVERATGAKTRPLEGSPPVGVSKTQL